MSGIPDPLVWEALLGFGFGPGELECEAEMRAALEAIGLPALLERVEAAEGEGCDCTELCSMGPTCPGGMLAGLEGSGCWRTGVTE